MKTEIIYTSNSTVILTIGSELTVSDAQIALIKDKLGIGDNAPGFFHQNIDGLDQIIISPKSNDTSRVAIHKMIETVLNVKINRAP